MPRLIWDDDGKHFFETGISKGVFYNKNNSGKYPTGVVWNGLSGVTESPSGGEASPIYADNIKYLNLFSVEEFGLTIEAYTYPDEFAECDGSKALAEGVTVGQQPRSGFGFSYQTKIGNEDGQNYGYKIHMVYGAKASPAERAYQTINDNPDASAFSWEVSTTPVNVTGAEPTSLVVVDSTKVDAGKLAILEGILYGADAEEFDSTETYAVGDYVTHTTKTYVCVVAIETPGEWDADKWSEVTEPGPRLPLPDEVIGIFED